MMQKYEMSDLGKMSYFLRIEVNQTEKGIFICQRKYAASVLEKYKMFGCKAVNIPLVAKEKFVKDNGSGQADGGVYRSLIGSLMYLTATRPDILYSASLLSRYMSNPTNQHFTAAKRVLRFISGTIAHGIWYCQIENPRLTGYTDSDWGGCSDDMKNTSGYVFSFGSGAFSWSTKKQTAVALSTAEAEYIAAARATAQAVWLKRIFQDLTGADQGQLELFSDSKAAIAISANLISHDRTKHILIKYHFIRDAVEKKEIKLVHCSTDEQCADMFTKALSRERFEKNSQAIGVIDTPFAAEGEC